MSCAIPFPIRPRDRHRPDGEGDDRRLALTLRHADGTALVCYLSDAGMGRLGDLIVRVYGESVVAAATAVVGSVQ